MNRPPPPSSGVRDFFDRDSEDYQLKHYGPGARSFMSVRLERMLHAVDGLQLPTGALVLDAGCGPGDFLLEMLRRGFRAIGVDTSSRMLKQARHLLAAEPHAHEAELQQARIEQLPFADGCFDLVSSAGVLEYLAADAPAIRELSRVVRPGGHLLLPITNAWSPAGWLDAPVEWLKRRPSILGLANRLRLRAGRPVLRARYFQVRKQTRRGIRAELERAGMSLRAECYFHFLPWPRPVDKLFPRLTAALGVRMEPLAETWLGPLGEGYLSLARKGLGR